MTRSSVWVSTALEGVRELITGDAIDLLVISHSDADHLGDGARIFNEKRVRHDSGGGAAHDGLLAESRGCHGRRSERERFGSQPPIPAAGAWCNGSSRRGVVTLVAGWPRWDGPGPTPSERLNAISIVVRLDWTAAGPSCSRGIPLGDASTMTMMPVRTRNK